MSRTQDCGAEAPSQSGGACASHDALLPLARRAADEGAYARVSELFAAARAAGFAPGDASCWRTILIEAGDFNRAQEAERLMGDPGAPQADTERFAPGAGESLDDADVLDFEPGARATAQPAVAPELVAAFLRWFAGRGDVYARQWYDARRDRSGYWPVREPLAAAVVQQHLLGRLTLGQYVVHPDDTVSFAALDLDPTAEAIEHMRLAEGEEGATGPGAARLLEYALHICAAAERAGLPLLAEDTGGAGIHLWLFFAPRVAAGRARGLLRELLWRAGPQPPSVAVELFPKQDRLSGKGLGNLIKLPLGVHQVTLRPSRLLDPEGHPIAAAEALTRLRAAPPVAVDALITARVVPLRQTETSDSAPRAPAPLAPPEGPSPRALAEALAAVAPGREATAAADRVLAGCAIVRELARRAHEEATLPAGAARALLYTVGLVGRENERIDTLFATAGISRKEIDRVRRGLQSPIGCRKLHERFPELAHACACPAPPPGGYATPALFAFRRPPATHRPKAPWPDLGDLGAASTDASMVELQRRLGRIEAALDRLVEGGAAPIPLEGGAAHRPSPSRAEQRPSPLRAEHCSAAQERGEGAASPRPQEPSTSAPPREEPTRCVTHDDDGGPT